jgi:hypothetical protein
MPLVWKDVVCEDGFSSEYKSRVEALNAILAAVNSKHNPKPFIQGCRDMSLCFHDGQRIRHKRSLPEPWIATYQKATNTILYKGTSYTSLSKFALEHIRTENANRSSVDGWIVCEVEEAPGSDKWISTYRLPARNVIAI